MLFSFIADVQLEQSIRCCGIAQGALLMRIEVAVHLYACVLENQPRYEKMDLLMSLFARNVLWSERNGNLVFWNSRSGF